MNIARCRTEARAFLQKLLDDPPRLPYEPTLMPLLFAATRENSTTSVPRLTALIERSQKLAARVLSVANSACYALESRVTSINRAVVLLGFNEVRSLVIMVGATAALKGAKLPPTFDSMEMWRHHLLTAAYAKTLTSTLLRGGFTLGVEPDEIYVAGLLHDIGKAFLAGRNPKVWGIVSEAVRNGADWATAENDYWGIEHALIGAQVLNAWKLPLLLTDLISWHHSPKMAPTFAMEAGILAAANMLAHQGLEDDGGLPESVRSVLPEGADFPALAEACAAAPDHAKLNALAGAQV